MVGGKKVTVKSLFSKMPNVLIDILSIGGLLVPGHPQSIKKDFSPIASAYLGSSQMNYLVF